MTSLDARLASYSSPVLSIFRIVFGLVFTFHGTMKLFGWPLGQAVPVGTWPFWFAGLLEFVLGILITIGLFTRIAAFIASGEMAVAYLWQHWGILGGTPGSFWPYDAQAGGNGGEASLLFCFAFLLLAALGGGALSVDGRRRVAGGSGVRRGRVVTGTAAPPVTATPTAQPARRGGLLSRFRRPRY
ncbi:DoxX family protein [Mycolicibacterium iranicum]|uniref:DoxX family protein n=1 Tax=Mycolicibacterium iranicum TaxID=912594 RepID=A0A178LWI3_MYCIR|nr:DoxX family protein [Mycolicibacterium iranicum]OAN37748.1 DoxX family protein [Mycolicibacterium iranicum]